MEGRERRVFVLWWKYQDGSDSGVIRAFASEESANEQLSALNDHGDRMKDFRVDSTPYSDSEKDWRSELTLLPER